jgi:hypothetical protein
MAAKVSLYNLGTQGVDLTRSVVHAEDGTLRQAQNAVPDMRGEFGGVAKRDGLAAITATTAGGAVTGVIPAALSGKGSSQGGIKVFMGMEQSNAGLFLTTTDYFATGAAYFPDANTEILPSDAYDPIANARTWTRPAEIGSPGRAAVWNNQIYFVYGEDAAPITNADLPTQIHVIDSAEDRRFFTRVPVNPDVGAESKGILAMMTQGDYLYVSVWDVGTSSADFKGSVYRINASTGVCEKLGATFPTGYLPISLAWHQGKLWVGTYSEDVTASGRVYWIRPGVDETWTLDHTTTAGQGEVFSLCQYGGKLYAAVGGSNTLAGLVKVRATDGTWSTSLTGVATTADNYFVSLVVFKEELYASYYNHDGGGTPATTFHRFNGSAWSTVHTEAEANRQSPYKLYVAGENERIIAAGIQASGFYVSSDGTTWTERISNAQNTTKLNSFGFIGV